MEVNDLYRGAPVMYQHKPYMVVNINKDKLGIVECNRAGWYDKSYDGNEIKFVKLSLVQPIPLAEVLVRDTRFRHGVITIGKTTLQGLLYESTHFSMFLCKDSKYIDVYRLFLNHNDYGISYYDTQGSAVPVICCLPITYIHELCMILKKFKYNIQFRLID